MARIKVDYGIDLGTTNSAISRMEKGEPNIKKTDTLKDTMPSSVYINKKKAIQVGDSAYNALKKDKLKAMKSWNDNNSNAFIEFKRTMGTNKSYHSSNLGQELSSESLSSEILKTLKSFIKDEDVNSIVITVPAAFKNNQKEATREAAKLAGFNHVELLQEPVAASMAYGLDTDKKDGFWLVFDFGGGTFDAALLKVEEGIMKVIDTEGDNYLGGKNLDYAIVDGIILPYLEENYTIDSILADDNKKQILRNAMKFFAEETKVQLSFNDTHEILSDLGDIPGEDDEGEEFELDITVSQEDMHKVLGPVFQKAIDVSLTLLNRNNLQGSSLDSLILVGGPTFSPVLRSMLKEQICEPDTSADPMTVVSKGAALYASTINVSEEVREETRDKTKIQLEISNESSSVETEEFVPIKILKDKTEGTIPNKVEAEVIRGDKGWSSGKVEINWIGDVFEIQLEEGKTNFFDVLLYDEVGNILESEPSSFSIIQGSKIGNATLSYNIGIEVEDLNTGKVVFKTVKGLEKNQSIPAVGTKNGLKTPYAIRPGVASDFIKIPIYEGEHASDGTRAIYNDHIKDIIITGEDLPGLLPENSDLDLTINLDRSENITVTAFFPYLDFEFEAKASSNKSSISSSWLDGEIRKAKNNIAILRQDEQSNSELKNLEEKLSAIENNFNNNKNDVDSNQEVLTNLRKTLKVVDTFNDSAEWPKLEARLKSEFERVEQANEELGNEKTTEVVNNYRIHLQEVVTTQDIKLANALLEELSGFFMQLTLIYQLIGFVRHHHENFDSFNWKNNQKARSLINEGLKIISENPVVDQIHPLVVAIIDLLPDDNKESIPGGGVLRG